MNIIKEIDAAEQRIRPHILKTPLLVSKALSQLIDGTVYLKLESEQHTGSFKARGSLNKVLSLTDGEKKLGVVTASTGNHAQGFARALDIVNCQGTVYLPGTAAAVKVKALKKYDVQLEFYGNNSLEAEIQAKKQALATQQIWVSPYNDPHIIGGQGTIAIELIEQLEDFDHLLITVGGGGLISGIGSYIAHKKPNTKIVGCLPENAPEMAMSIKAGKIVQLEEERATLSEASAGGIEEGSITFPICQKVIDTTILVSEPEIAEAMKLVWNEHGKIIEGAAGVAVASLIKNKAQFKGSTVVILICGANIDPNKFKTIVQGD